MKTVVFIVLFCATILAAAHGATAKRIQPRPDQVRSRATRAAARSPTGGPGGRSDGIVGRLHHTLKMPDGYRIAPHWHPKRENVTVISGSFKVGMGDSFDVSKMSAFPAGSFAYMDPSMHHYGMAVGETVVQIHGTCATSNQLRKPGRRSQHEEVGGRIALDLAVILRN